MVYRLKKESEYHGGIFIYFILIYLLKIEEFQWGLVWLGKDWVSS